VQLCFEAIFPELVRAQVRLGAEILLNLSNDAWLQTHAGGEQHLQMVQLRAVETRRWVVRSTTTGVSAFIDPHGIERGRIDPDHRGALVMPVQPGEGQTVYVRVGDVFAYACMTLALVAVVGAGRRSVS
jgi:apolipoprotein N-acyltransferase